MQVGGTTMNINQGHDANQNVSSMVRTCGSKIETMYNRLDSGRSSERMLASSDSTLEGQPISTPPFAFKSGRSDQNQYESIPECNAPQGMRIKPGITVELGYDTHEAENRRRGDFFRIHRILRCSNGLKLEGWRFRRNDEFGACLPHKLNEVCLLAKTQHGDGNAVMMEALELIDVGKIYRRRKMTLTNHDFPAQSFRDHTHFDSSGPHAQQVKLDIFRGSELTCRWIYITREDNKRQVPFEGTYRILNETEADEKASTPDVLRRTKFRDHTIPSFRDGVTLGDGFCGAGGVSQGAHDAGLTVRWGFDNDQEACLTYLLNGSDADVYNMDVQEIVHIQKDMGVQVLHLSTPCQPFCAQNHRVGIRNPLSEGGRRDEANEAASLCIKEMVEKCKPRVVTVEQTSGMLTHHPQNFHALIGQFTSGGYSVRYKVLNFANYGLPQERKRLILFASCPGGVLPTFPKPTHGPCGTFSQRWTTIHDWIDEVRPSHGNHHPVNHMNSAVTSAHRQLRGLISCSGTTDIHPSGQRKYTVRELARLMTLPLNWVFPQMQTEGAMKRQIGNMVPPIVMKVLLGHVADALNQETVKWRQEAGLV
ncbi:MAG: hypothetical protein M1831_006324 [Alyxoria varia]|nr:MAG: hypothetical protein M1831_006324 [Alyxoria varia]